MTDLLRFLETLRRPRLLIRAARFATTDYARSRHLSRLLGADAPDRALVILTRLIALEATLDHDRLCDDAGYSVSKHIEVLAAIMAEARRLKSDDGPQFVDAVAVPT